jgi:EpsI family protein
MTLHLRFAVVVALLGSTALLLRGRSGNEIIPARQSLSTFPRVLGGWTGTDVQIPQDALDVLGPGDFLLRAYEDRLQQEPQVDLFVAYFPSQRVGDTIHSPKHCLPGAGWLPVESGRVTISLPGRAPFQANRYVIAKGEERQFVLYWYLAHDRALASEYWAKFYLISDAIKMNRSDGSLIRLTTPLRRGEGTDSAQLRLLAFAGNLISLVNDYIPR